MTRITFDLNKSVEQNASVYFEKAKKARAKAQRAKAALLISEKKLAEYMKKKPDIKKIEFKSSARKKEWYEKFRWFYSSEGFLVVGGRDATTNEIIIKKHTEKDDIVFHTDMAGSPFFVIKTEGKKPGEETMQETANATASYSRAWKLGLSTSEVFYVAPDQVSKTALPGEHIGRGAFMIYGKTTYIKPEMKCAVGIKEGMIIGGPVFAIKANTDKFAIVFQGQDKPSDTAKKVRKILGEGDLDDIIRFLPPGNCRIEKTK